MIDIKFQAVKQASMRMSFAPVCAYIAMQCDQTCFVNFAGLAICRQGMMRTSLGQQQPQSKVPLIRCRERIKAWGISEVTPQKIQKDLNLTMVKLTLRSKLPSGTCCPF